MTTMPWRLRCGIEGRGDRSPKSLGLKERPFGQSMSCGLEGLRSMPTLAGMAWGGVDDERRGLGGPVSKL